MTLSSLQLGACRIVAGRRVARAQPFGAKRVAVQQKPLLRVARASAVEAEAVAAASSDEGTSKIALTDIAAGQSYNGTVKFVQTYGAFVDIGAESDGLVHISQMADGYVKDPNEICKAGDSVTVRVLSVDGKKIALTMKSEEAATERAQRTGKIARGAKKDNRGSRAEKREVPVKKNDEINGTVARVTPWGVFVTVAEGFEGLLHQSEVKTTEIEPRLVAMFKEGDEVAVRVLKVDGEKISLTQKSDEERQPFKAVTAEVDPSSVTTVMEYLLRRAGITPDMFPSREAAGAM
jgi:elongation factor Ts